MKALISIILCFAISFLVGRIAYLQGCTQFNSFVGDTLIQMLGTIFAINIGIIPVLYYELKKIEKQIGEHDVLSYVKKEIKQNATVMTSLVILSIFLTIIKGFAQNTFFDYLLSSIILGVVFLIVLMVFDTVSGVLALDFNFGKDEE